MKCDTAKGLIILDLYGELGDAEKAGLHDHIQRCRACSEELALTKKVFSLLDDNRPAEAPAADWEKAWRGIQGGLSRPSSNRRFFGLPGRRWIFAGSALALVLIAGILIGKYGLAPSSPPAAIAARTAPDSSSSPNGIRPAFAAHLDDLKPILVDYAHFETGEKAGQRIAIDENVLRGLLLQNLLLKRKLAEKDPAAAELLDDIDVVLREITNQGAQDAQSPAQIRDLIERRNILFKLEILKKI